VQKKGFLNLISTLKQNYNLPARTKIVAECCNFCYLNILQISKLDPKEIILYYLIKVQAGYVTGQCRSWMNAIIFATMMG